MIEGPGDMSIDVSRPGLAAHLDGLHGGAKEGGNRHRDGWQHLESQNQQKGNPFDSVKLRTALNAQKFKPSDPKGQSLHKKVNLCDILHEEVWWS